MDVACGVVDVNRVASVADRGIAAVVHSMVRCKGRLLGA